MGLFLFIGASLALPAFPDAYRELYKQGRELLSYELPLPAPENAIKLRRWFEDMPKVIDMRGDEQEALWRQFIKNGCVRPTDEALLKDRGWMFPDLDRTALYCMLQHLKPRRMVEIGAGESTEVANAALERLVSQNSSIPLCEHTVIEPYRTSQVPRGPGVTVIGMELQALPDTALFESLASGDVLFIDSSHTVMPYGDTLTELLAILPRLHEGVYVHFHDIFLPWDYPKAWSTRNNLVYSEQWAIALLLCGASAEWEVVWSSWYMREQRQDALLAMPHYPLSAPTGPNGASLWLRKKAGPTLQRVEKRAHRAESQGTDLARKLWAEKTGTAVVPPPAGPAPRVKEAVPQPQQQGGAATTTTLMPPQVNVDPDAEVEALAMHEQEK